MGTSGSGRTIAMKRAEPYAPRSIEQSANLSPRFSQQAFNGPKDTDGPQGLIRTGIHLYAFPHTNV
jgi:hypothetical protein